MKKARYIYGKSFSGRTGYGLRSVVGHHHVSESKPLLPTFINKTVK